MVQFEMSVTWSIIGGSHTSQIDDSYNFKKWRVQELVSMATTAVSKSTISSRQTYWVTLSWRWIWLLDLFYENHLVFLYEELRFVNINEHELTFYIID